MPAITALLHTSNDVLRLGRCLETLRPCREILVVDHGSSDATLRVAREYGARILRWEEGLPFAHYLRAARHDWILCLDPREALTESLEATLLEWGSELESGAGRLQGAKAEAFSVRLREQTCEGWVELPGSQTRLVSREWNRWQGSFPAHESSATLLQGELLRFVVP
jgi:glycosyltransferase involved in cell wall biosynthesis